jgi:hypothetical protein
MTARNPPNLLSGKKGLVLGLANRNSIGYGAALAFHRAGAELILTYGRPTTEQYVRPLLCMLANLNPSRRLIFRALSNPEPLSVTLSGCCPYGSRKSVRCQHWSKAGQEMLSQSPFNGFIKPRGLARSRKAAPGLRFGTLETSLSLSKKL